MVTKVLNKSSINNINYMKDTDYMTTITLRNSIRNRLNDLGKKGDSFDSIIVMLLDSFEKKHSGGK